MPSRRTSTVSAPLVYLQGVLIEAKDLVNGVSILQAEQIDEVEYLHIELDSHDVIVAEGALSEVLSTMIAGFSPRAVSFLQCSSINAARPS